VKADETHPETETRLVYREDRSAMHPALTANAVISLVLMLGFGAAMNLPHLSGLGIIAALAGVWALFMWLPLILGSYVGIRADTSGIQIGGIRARERRLRQHRWPPRRPFHVGSQGRAVFTCPWEGVRSLYLLTDRAEIKRLMRDWSRFRKQTAGLRSPLGALSTPFTTSMLVITHNATDAASDPAEFRPNWGQLGGIRPVQSPTWFVSTNNPDALRAVLEEIPGAPSVQDTLPPEAVFQFRSG